MNQLTQPISEVSNRTLQQIISLLRQADAGDTPSGEGGLSFLDFILPDASVDGAGNKTSAKPLQSSAEQTQEPVKAADKPKEKPDASKVIDVPEAVKKADKALLDNLNPLKDPHNSSQDSDAWQLPSADVVNNLLPNSLTPNFMMPGLMPSFQWQTVNTAGDAGAGGYSLIEPEALAEAISQARSRQSSIRVDVTDETSVVLRFTGDQVAASFLTHDQPSTMQLAQAIQVFQQRIASEHLPVSEVSVTYEPDSNPFGSDKQDRQRHGANTSTQHNEK